MGTAWFLVKLLSGWGLQKQRSLLLNSQTVKPWSSPEQVISELWGVTCHMASHSVTCCPTQVNTEHAPLNPSHTGWYLINLTWRDGGWVDLGGWVHTSSEMVYLSADTHPSSNHAHYRATTLILDRDQWDQRVTTASHSHPVWAHVFCE